MKYLKLKLLVFICSLSIAWIMSASAAQPTCHSYSSGPYCQYVGKVSKVYVNDGNMILLYFDTPMDASAPANVGMSATRINAAAFLLSDNVDFGKLLYSTLLSAQASNREVTVQMRGDYSGYVVIDRIWLAE